MSKANHSTTKFLDELNHPFRKEIELLRGIILNASDTLSENIKWNGPNYFVGGTDMITMKIQPPKQILLIFHRGAKKQEPMKSKLIADDSGLLVWKENDRAIASFANEQDIKKCKTDLEKIIKDWTEAVSSI